MEDTMRFFAEVEFDNPNCDYGVLVDDNYDDLVVALLNAKRKKFDYNLGGCPNLKVLSVGKDGERDVELTEKIKKLVEGGETSHPVLDSESFVKTLPSQFVLDAVDLIHNLWTCTDTVKHQDPKDMENSLTEIADRVWRFKTVHTEELKSIDEHNSRVSK